VIVAVQTVTVAPSRSKLDWSTCSASASRDGAIRGSVLFVDGRGRELREVNAGSVIGMVLGAATDVLCDSSSMAALA
jgi:hypothetical protein